MRGTTTTARGPVPRAGKTRSRRPSGRRDSQNPWTSQRGPVTTSPTRRRSETAFNADGTPREVQHLTGGTGTAVLARWVYSYDDAQRVHETDQFISTTRHMTDEYMYDDAGHLETWNQDPAGGTATSRNYEYDADGNRTGDAGIISTFRADGSILTSDGSAAFKYDGAGALREDNAPGACSTRTYDGFDRMTTQTQKAGCTGGTHAYTYLPDNRQATRTNNATVTQNRWAGGMLLAEETASLTATARYITSPLGTHAVSTAATSPGPVVQYIKQDGQGSTGLLTATSGTATVCAASYSPWGSTRQFANATQCGTSNTANNILYRGSARDPGSGTYRWGNRNYNPSSGTWLTADSYQATEAPSDLSIGIDPLTQNRYSYVNGDPINLTDPSGHQPIDCVDNDVVCSREPGAKTWNVHPLTDEELAQRQQEWYASRAAQVARDYDAGVLEINLRGACVDVIGSAGVVAGEVQSCLIYDGDSVASLLFGALGGGGGGYVGGSVGGLVSNATSSDDLLGASICVGVSGTAVVGVSGEVCFSIDEKGNPTGVWSLNLGVTAGGGVEGHVLLGDTKELWKQDIPCIEGWDLPKGPSVFGIWELPDGPKLPSMGCGSR